VAARRNGLFVTHVRYELGDGFLDPMREAIDIGKLSGVKVHISHLRGDRLGKPDTNPDRLFALFEQARADGVDLTYDSYAYPRGSSLLHRLLPGWSHVGGPDKILERLQNPADRERVKEHLRGLTIDWSNVTIGGVLSKQSQRLEGWSIAEAAGEMGVDVADYVCDILVETNLGVQYLSDPSSTEESIERVLAHPLATSGSDGLCWGSARHPRTYGSFARVLGRYVRERKVMPLEDAVRKMTGACAARLALKDRGLIREGYAADIAVWDDATIIDNSTYEKPLQTASGVSYVLVNGTFTLDQGAHTGATAGRALKPLIE
jgi:N-acyl-D-amino-acid deacylase